MIYKIALIFFTHVALASDGFTSSSFFTLGYGTGGESLSASSGGQDYNTQAGAGMFFGLGKIFAISPTVPHRFEAQLGMGYLFQSDARNEDNLVSFSRFPIEAIYFYRNTVENFRLGWGSTYHIAGGIRAKGSNESAATSVENAWGFIFTAEKLFLTSVHDAFSIGIRHTSIRYRLTAFDSVVNGDNWSVTFSGFLF